MAASESKGNPNVSVTQDLISLDYRSAADLKHELANFRGSFHDNWTPNMKIGIDSYRHHNDEKSEIQIQDIQIQDQSFNNSAFRFYDDVSVNVPKDSSTQKKK